MLIEAHVKRERYMTLYARSLKDSHAAKAHELLSSIAKEFPDLGPYKAIELGRNSIGEPLPCLLTELGFVHGLSLIEYFVDTERRLLVEEAKDKVLVA